MRMKNNPEAEYKRLIRAMSGFVKPVVDRTNDAHYQHLLGKAADGDTFAAALVAYIDQQDQAQQASGYVEHHNCKCALAPAPGEGDKPTEGGRNG